MLRGIVALLEQTRSNLGSRFNDVSVFDRFNLIMEGVGLTALIEAAKNTLGRLEESPSANFEEFWIALERYSVPYTPPDLALPRKSVGHGG
jgi:hypothetical protein